MRVDLQLLCRLIKPGFFICTLLLPGFSFGQHLSLEDIFKIPSLDSISLKQFCVERKFKLVMIDEDDWVFDYTFQATEDEKISFNRTFPKGKAANPFVRYYFNEQMLYQSFEDSIKARGFVRFRYKKSPRNNRDETPTKTFVHDKSEFEIGLEKYKTGPQDMQ